MSTAGELLARQLSGDTSVSNADIINATEHFFKDAGALCKCTVGATPQQNAEAGEQQAKCQKDARKINRKSRR